MALFDKRGTLDALHDLFDRERKAILEGRFDILDRLGTEKERLFSSVFRDGVDQSQLKSLRIRAERNKVLLAAMEQGVRSAARRIEALRSKPADLRTYDASGRRQSIAANGVSLHRRA
jgi:hypothetical protein